MICKSDFIHTYRLVSYIVKYLNSSKLKTFKTINFSVLRIFTFPERFVHLSYTMTINILGQKAFEMVFLYLSVQERDFFPNFVKLFTKLQKSSQLFHLN